MRNTTIYEDIRNLIGDEIPSYKVNDINVLKKTAMLSVSIEVDSSDGKVILQATAGNPADVVKSLIKDYNAPQTTKREVFKLRPRSYLPVTYFI